MTVPEALLIIILVDPSGSGMYRDIVSPVQRYEDCEAEVRKYKAMAIKDVGNEYPMVVVCERLRKAGDKDV